MKIEDYALIGDTQTAALVSTEGSIDWFCAPRFDSASCFSKLLGNNKNGFWKIAPVESASMVSRSYVGNSLVLETVFETSQGSIKLTDCMPIRDEDCKIVRIIEGLSGTVDVEMTLVIRFGYGKIVPWVMKRNGILQAIAGPDALSLWTPVETHGKDMTTIANFKVSQGSLIPFVLTYHDSAKAPSPPVDAKWAVLDTVDFWENWVSNCNYEGPYKDDVVRSLVTLKALTYAPTGGIVAAPTTSLPETLGGERNWDYRYCWIRDASLTLQALMRGGYHEEASAWKDWLVRAVAGSPSEIQIMYGVGGERRLEEYEIDWLDGFENSKPVRIGNAAAGQYQLDVYGELLCALHDARACGHPDSKHSWNLQVTLLDFLSSAWKEPDEGIWEIRGPRRHFTYSKVMAWAAFDRGIKAVHNYGLPGNTNEWQKIRDDIKQDVLKNGWNKQLNSFTQYYGGNTLDASVLLMPSIGFIDATDSRFVSTIESIKKNLISGEFVLRYNTEDSVDGLTGVEGAFLACSFWLVDALTMMGNREEAQALFEKLLSVKNNLGLISEEYDPSAKRQVGNFPQAFTHVSLINSAYRLLSKEPTMTFHERGEKMLKERRYIPGQFLHNKRRGLWLHSKLEKKS
jgi:GH15 family glucan-1,4-alpha-glucosidase